MSDIGSSKSKMQIEESQYRSAVSEAWAQKVGANINQLIDDDVTQAASIATNASNISTNTSNINTNGGNITTNADDITAIENAFSTAAFTPSIDKSSTTGGAGSAVSASSDDGVLSKQFGNIFVVQYFGEGFSGTDFATSTILRIDVPDSATVNTTILPNTAGGDEIPIIGTATFAGTATFNQPALVLLRSDRIVVQVPSGFRAAGTFTVSVNCMFPVN